MSELRKGLLQVHSKGSANILGAYFLLMESAGHRGRRPEEVRCEKEAGISSDFVSTDPEEGWAFPVLTHAYTHAHMYSHT